MNESKIKDLGRGVSETEGPSKIRYNDDIKHQSFKVTVNTKNGSSLKNWY